MPTIVWNRRLWALLLVLSGNMLIDSLEVSTIAIAMPSLSRGLHASPATASWVMTSFAVGFGAAILPGGHVTARFGRRRVYLAALLVFAAASLLAGLAADEPVLIAARVVKGACVGLMAPTGLAIIASVFPEGRPRQRAVSVYSLFGASGFSAGLLLSGALTLVGWRWALLFSFAAALALVPFALTVIPPDASQGPAVGMPTTSMPASTVPGRSALAGSFPHWRLLRSAAGAAALNGPFWGFLFVVTFALQRTAGWSPLTTGLMLLPASLPLTATVLYSGRLIARFGAGRLIAAGSLAALGGYAWLLRGLHPGYLASVLPATVLPATVLVGAGYMASFSALHLQATAGVPAARQPAATGIYQTSVQLGGAATLTAVAAAATAGIRPALAVVTAVAAAGALLAAPGQPRGAPQAPRQR